MLAMKHGGATDSSNDTVVLVSVARLALIAAREKGHGHQEIHAVAQAFHRATFDP